MKQQLKRVLLGCSLLAIVYVIGGLISRDSVHAQIVNSVGGSASVPTGTGFPHITSAAQDAAARAVNLASNGASGDVTGTLDKANIGTLASGSNGLAASATTDATNAANIGSGALPAGRMPALTGDCTTSAGAVATTCANLNGIPQFAPAYLTSAMTQQTSTSCTNITNMTWTLAANKNYLLSCRVPVTYTASSTIQFCMNGTGTPASVSMSDTQGLTTTGASQFEVFGAATWANAKTAVTSSPGALSRGSLVTAQIQVGASGAGSTSLGTIANGTNGITIGADSSCQLTQVN